MTKQHPVDIEELRRTYVRVLEHGKRLLDLAHAQPESKEGREAFLTLFRCAETLSSSAKLLVP